MIRKRAERNLSVSALVEFAKEATGSFPSSATEEGWGGSVM